MVIKTLLKVRIILGKALIYKWLEFKVFHQSIHYMWVNLTKCAVGKMYVDKMATWRNNMAPKTCYLFMSIFLPVCLPACLSACLPACLLSACLPACPPARPPARLPARPPANPPACLPACLFCLLSICCLSVCLSAHPPARPSVRPSVCLPIYLFLPVSVQDSSPQSKNYESSFILLSYLGTTKTWENLPTRPGDSVSLPSTASSAAQKVIRLPTVSRRMDSHLLAATDGK